MESESPVIRDQDAQPVALQTLGNIRYVGNVGPLFEALAKAQAEFVEMERDAQVSFDKRMFKYATLAEVLSSVRPALNKHGLALLQPFDGDKVVTILAFGASRLEVDAPLPNWKDVQALGSALTYVKRYQLKSLLGVNDGEDDDGNGSVGSDRKPEPRKLAQPPAAAERPKANADGTTPETHARLVALAKAAGFNRVELDKFSREKGCGPLENQTEINALRLIVALEGLRAQ